MRPNDIENYQDLARYYQRGWVSILMDDTGNNYPFRLEQNDQNTCVGNLNRGPDVNYATAMTTFGYNEFLKKVSLGRPEVGMCPHGINLSYLVASSRREAQRGLRPSTLDRQFFNGWDSKKYNIQVNINQSIWEIFNPRYWGIREAYKSIESGERVGCPVSLRTGLIGFRGEQYPRVVYKNASVGIYDGKCVLLFPDFEQYIEFIRDDMKTEVRIQI